MFLKWDKVKENAEINEAYFTGLCWSNPDLYLEYNEDRINKEHFLHDVWYFFFALGRHMFKNKVKTFDDISIVKTLKELDIKDRFEEYGGFETIEEIKDNVKDYEDNIESYYNNIKKTSTLKELGILFGKKVLEKKGKYDPDTMSKEQISTYWNDKVNKIAMNEDNQFDVQNLLIDPELYIQEIEDRALGGMSLYKSNHMNKITGGTHKGHVHMFGSFGNAGKTSLTFSKYIMAHIANGEKIAVIANEEDAKSFRDKLVITMLGAELGEAIERRKLNQGNLSEEDKDKIRKAFNKAKELSEGDDGLVKFIFMENYIIEDLKKIIKHLHNRGYESFMIDTHKVSEGSKQEKRWMTFVEDMKEIYKITRPDAGGLNLRMWVNFQLADYAIKHRFLDFEAIGEGKGAKNEASVVQMMRRAWSDEYEHGVNEITGFRYIKNEFGGGFEKQEFKLKEGKIYFLLFTPKNRFGLSTEMGGEVLIFETNFNSNYWKEIGWCHVANDKSR